MNNKGQTLVIFIIVLPIILIMFTLIVDLGLLSIEKRKIDNNTYDAVEYYLNNIEKEDIKESVNKLLEENLDNINININEENDYIIITVTKVRESLYSIIKQEDEIKVIYKGNKTNKEIIKG